MGLTPGTPRRQWRAASVLASAGLLLTACATVGPPRPDGVNGTMRPYEVHGVWYTPRYQPDYDQVGLASWYQPQSPDHRTADGEAFRVDLASAAHKTLPLPCMVEVTDLETGRRIRVRVNDRGPFVSGRIIDLSPKAAQQLGLIGRGSTRVRVRYIGPASGLVTDPVITQSSPPPPLPPAASPGFHIQAAAFADRSNAEKAVAVLSVQGYAYIIAVPRGSTTLYRVDVDCPSGAAPIEFRARVIAAGFPQARLVAGS